MTTSLVHPNLKYLSHSTESVWASCFRKAQISKLRPGFGTTPDIEDDDELPEGQHHLDFGTVVGIGIAEYLISKDVKHAYWKMFNSWTLHLEDDEGEKKKKTFWHSLMAIDKFKMFCEINFGGYELVSFNGKPATELGFSIDCGDGYYYRGYLDALLMRMRNSALVPLEIKTTGNWVVHEAMYKNQGQTSGYKLIVDAIAKILDIPTENSYRSLYGVYQTSRQEWEQFEFTKTTSGLTRWVKGLLARKQSIEIAASNSFFPMNGNACYSYGKPCRYFGLCEMDDSMLFGPGLEKVEEVDMIKDRIKYEFHFKLDDLITMLMEEGIK